MSINRVQCLNIEFGCHDFFNITFIGMGIILYNQQELAIKSIVACLLQLP